MLSMGLSSMANAALELVITEGINSARPIGIVPFKWQGATKLPHDVSKVIASDLQRSGKFSPIPVNKMPQTPYDASEIDFEAWTNLGVDAVLTGSITQDAKNNYVISYKLVDVIRGQLTQGKSKSLNEKGELVLSEDHILFNKKATVPGPRLESMLTVFRT